MIFLFVIVASFGFGFGDARAADPWYNASWGYRVKVTINTAQVPSTQANFPVYVNLANLPAGFFTHVKASGADIRLTTSDGVTELAREIVFISTGTSSGELWFKATSISNGAYFYIYYGNAGATEPVASSVYGSQKVWDDGGSAYFKGVWHLPNGTALTILDSTGSNIASNSGGATVTTGKVDGGVNFSGASQFIDSGSMHATVTSATTISAWIKPGTSQAQYADIWGNHQGDFKGLVLQQNSTSLNNYYWSYGDGSSWPTTGTFNIPASVWTHVVAVKDATYCHIYINGTENVGVRISCPSNIIPATSINFSLGRGFSGGGRFFNGAVDEVKLSNFARSADWIKTEYNNQNAPTTFYAISAEEIPIVIGVTLTSDGTIAYGSIALDTERNTTASDLNDTQVARNSGTVAEDFNIKTSNAIGGTQWATGSVPGSNIFVHSFSANSGTFWESLQTANSYESLVANVAVNATQNFDLKIHTPLATSDYQQKTITVTVQAVQY